MINSAACIGIGAVGAIQAWKLSKTLGHDHVSVIVDDERKHRYESQGIFLNGTRIDFAYTCSRSEQPPADLIIVATKNNHLNHAIELMKPHVGDRTTILSLLNGLDSEHTLARAFPCAHVLYGFITALDSTRTGNRIEFSTEGTIYLGEGDNSRTDCLDAVCSLFERAGISHVVPQDIHTEMWAKFMVNVSINTLSALFNAGYGPCSQVPELRSLIVETQREVISLAQRQGINLDDSHIQRYQRIFASLEPSGKTSMLQDIEAGRSTENEWFCGSASRMGRELGISTPMCDLLYRLMDAREAVNRYNAS